MKNLFNAQIKQYKGRPSIFIDGKFYTPVIYSLTDCPGGRLSYEELPSHSIRRFAQMGFKLFQLDIWLDDMWFKDGTFDISMARRQIKGIIDICPDAAVFLRFHTTPPKWWNHLNKDELTEYADINTTSEKELSGPTRYLIQDKSPVYRHSFASLKWLMDSTRMLIRFLAELSKTEEGTYLAGMQPATGVYGEHHYWAFMDHEPDTGKSMQTAFRKYLQQKYESDKALQKAWNNPYVSIADSIVPGLDERKNNTDGIFRDPEKERNIIDYYDCQHKLVADSIVHFCKTIKENWPAQIITGAFYGYYISLFGRAAAGGHLSEQTILNSPYIDCLCAPQAYNSNLRDLGGAGASRGLLLSALLHGKLWLDEMDQPTHKGTLFSGMPVYGIPESKQLLRRNSIFPILHGAGLWYYDFGPHGTSGWWDHPVYESEIGGLKKLIDKNSATVHHSPCDVLLVFDTTVYKYTAFNEQKDPVTDAACVNTAYPMALRSGAAIDTIYLSDLKNINPDKYKCIVFMNTFVLTSHQKDYIHKYICKNKRHVVWFYAPGYIDGHLANLRFIEDTTNLKLKRITIRGVPEIKQGRFIYDMHSVYEKLYGSPSDYPELNLFISVDKNRPTLIEKKFIDHTVWFSPIPFTTPEIFTHVFRQSGAHIYCDSADAVAAGSGILSIHSKSGGKRLITLTNGIEIEIETNAGETVLFDYNNGGILKRY